MADLIIDLTDTKAFIVDCSKKSMPKWIDLTSLSSSSLCSEELCKLPDINDLDAISRKTAYKRFTVISNILPFITDKNKRSAIISQTATDKGISRQTICNYLWLYNTMSNSSIKSTKTVDNLLFIGIIKTVQYTLQENKTACRVYCGLLL